MYLTDLGHRARRLSLAGVSGLGLGDRILIQLATALRSSNIRLPKFADTHRWQGPPPSMRIAHPRALGALGWAQNFSAGD
jgi:hypothetical protein